MTLESAIITFLVIAGLGMLIYTLIETIRLRIQVVPEEERLVIYRLGRFNRIAGPGLVHLIRRQDSIHQTILVRDRPVTSTVAGIMIHGVPFGYTLSFWCRTDLQLAAQEFEKAREQAQRAGQEFAGGISKQEFLTRLAVLPENERREQINTKVREGLINAVAQLQNEEPLHDGGDFAQALLPILPGLPPCDRLLAKLRTQLVRNLPTIGVFFNEIHPITVMTVHLGDDITGSFSRNRMVTIMKERFPKLSEQELMQALSSIQGFEQPERRIHFDGANTSSVEMRDDEDSMRYKFYPGGAAQQTGQSGAGKPPAVVPSPTPGSEPPLSRDDLNILKQVPRANSRVRAAGAP